MKISYKIPVSYMALILVPLFILVLGVFGFLGDSISQTASTKQTILLLFCLVFLYLLTVPRHKFVEASDSGISVPRIAFPPYVTKSCKWEDVIDHYIKADDNSNEILFLVTRTGKIKIYSTLCFENFEISFSPKSYKSLKRFIKDNLEKNGRSNITGK